MKYIGPWIVVGIVFLNLVVLAMRVNEIDHRLRFIEVHIQHEVAK